jgi:adenosylhomocysteinase
MDLGFALQARCLEAIALGKVSATDVVVPVPRWIEEVVADSYLGGIMASGRARR